MSSAELGARAHEGGTRFRIAAHAKSCELRLFREDGSVIESLPMRPDDGDPAVFALDVHGVGAGTRYRFVLDGEELSDPYARWLPEGIDRPAQVSALTHAWSRPAMGMPADLVVYELHVGTFTPEGTYAAATTRLDYLASLGVTALEVMPIAAFAGARGWGYDGVAHYAPFAPYGTPNDLAAFIDAAHERQIAVLLDVVYNHFGPDGNVLRRFVPEAFTSRVASPWGESPDFGNAHMRAYVLDNVRYWLNEFRFDGLRLDATHTLHDDGPLHIIAEIAKVAHEALPRRVVIAEDERNEAKLVRDFGLDAVWADDLHHQLHVRMTGEHDGYFAAYDGAASEIARAITDGWSYTGQTYAPSGKPRGTPTDGMEATAFVHCLQNHDQIGNRALGDRLTAASGLDSFAAASLLLLTLPSTPMLFMGQEWGTTSPFLYFTDHHEALGHAITEGRRKEFAAFGAFGDEAAREQIPDPQAEETFRRSHLDWSEKDRPPHARLLALYTRVLGLRASDPVLRDRARERLRARAEGELVIVTRWNEHGTRFVVANFSSAPLPFPRDVEGSTLVLASRDGLEATSTMLPPQTAVFFARPETLHE